MFATYSDARNANSCINSWSFSHGNSSVIYDDVVATCDLGDDWDEYTDNELHEYKRTFKGRGGFGKLWMEHESSRTTDETHLSSCVFCGAIYKMVTADVGPLEDILGDYGIPVEDFMRAIKNATR